MHYTDLDPTPEAIVRAINETLVPRGASPARIIATGIDMSGPTVTVASGGEKATVHVIVANASRELGVPFDKRYTTWGFRLDQSDWRPLTAT